MFVLIFLLAICASVWGYWLKVVNSGWGPMIKGSLPVIGYTHRIMGNSKSLWVAIEDFSRDSLANGGICRLVIALETYYVITDPEDLTTFGSNSIQKHFAFDFAKPWVGDGLLTASPSVWKRHRKLLNPAFSLPLLHSFLKVFNEQARELVSSLARDVDKGPVDISEHFREYALKSLCQAVLGLSNIDEIGLLKKYMHAVDKILRVVVTRFQNIWLQIDLIFKLTGYRNYEKNLIKDLNQMSDLVIQTKRLQNDMKASTNLNGNKNKVLIDLLLELSSNNILTEEEVREEVDTMLIAGSDTSSWLTTYILVAIGTYPDVQQKIIDELKEIFGDSDRDLIKEDLQKMVYTEAVIKEVLRLYPVAPISIRTAEIEYKLKNCTLKPGDHVIMSFYGLNRHPMWGPDANQLRPERWLEANNLPSNFGGFGVGKRSCIGKTYAMISIKTVVAHVLRHYHFFDADISKLKLKMDFILKPVSGHHIAFTKIH